jgi:hypothetical protein
MSEAPKTTPEPEKAMTWMFEFGEDGLPIGRDPRTMTHAELEAMGHHRMSRGEAIRAHCIDCCGGSRDEVRKCTAIKCPSWPFRMGADPWRTVSEGRRAAGHRLAAKRAAKSWELKSDLRPDDGTIPTATPVPSAEIIAETT